MDKIRKEWKLPVKTHMETLSPELIQTIEDKFYHSKKKTSASTKKPAKRTKKISLAKISKSTAKKKTVKKIKKGNTLLSSAEDKKVSSTVKSPTVPTKRKIIIRRHAAEAFHSKETVSGLKEKTVKSSPAEKSTSETQKQNVISSVAASSGPSKGLRLDLVSVKTTDPLDEMFWDRQKEEETKKQPKKQVTEKEIFQKFNATDFRKRELVFQPKKKRTLLTTTEFKSPIITTPKSHKRVIKVHGEMTIEKLCKKMSIKRQALLKKLKSEGMEIKGLSVLDFETIALVVPAFGFEAKNTRQTEKEILDTLERPVSPDAKAKLTVKPPVVTIMGHVDHGKTTLLDTIRKTKVAQKEAGGITQHIGAYSVSFKDKYIIFIDTPGHEAFTTMRSRGAKVTDIVVIVIAANAGVMPQTVEALGHAKAAKTPVIIAISKMDTPGANIEKIKKQMAEHGLVSEDWGGDTSFIPISAHKEEGIKELLEQIELVAEMQELKCQVESAAKGVVLEARKEKGLGVIVSLLIRDGTLKLGQSAIAGKCVGKIRQMKNDRGDNIKKIKPGFPVEVMGFQDLPNTGDAFCVVTNEKIAKNLVAVRTEKNNDFVGPLSPEQMLTKIQNFSVQKKTLPVILKTDVGGSLEALRLSLEKIKSDEIELKLIYSRAGVISESDVLLASTVSGIILGFNVRPNGKAVRMAKEKSVPIYTYSVIYELLDQVKKLMLGQLEAQWKEEDQGQAQVRDIFHISKVGVVAGCYVTDGEIFRHSLIRLVRDGKMIYKGRLSSLRRFKEDVKQVGLGLECGVSLENFNDIKPKDTIEAYIKKEQIRTEL